MLAVAVGLLLFGGIMFILQRGLVGLVFGVLLIGNAINTAIFISSAPKVGQFSFVDNIETSGYAANDPVPQALVLTAIVIGFAILAFMIALVKKMMVSWPGVQTSDLIAEETDE